MAQSITPSDRIQELGAISGDVATMLRSAGLAINALTGRKASAATNDEDDTAMEDDGPVTLDGQKQALENHVNDYYGQLQAVMARLRRQVYALEEAGIISAESVALGGATRAASGAGGAEGKITNGGLGNLDIGWLNSRGNRVGAEKEREIMMEVKELLQTELRDTD